LRVPLLLPVASRDRTIAGGCRRARARI